MKRQLYFTLCGLTGFILGTLVCAVITWLCPQGRADTETMRDTVTDTVVYFHPEAKDSVVVRYVTARLSAERDIAVAPDTNVTTTDTVRVQIPITQKHYTDSLYTAWVSGYDARIDSIRIFTPTVTVTKWKKHRWGVGIQAGYGTQGAYLGVGISYNVFTF